MNRQEYNAEHQKLRQEEQVIIDKIQNDPRMIAAQKKLDKAQEEFEQVWDELKQKHGHDAVISKVYDLLDKMPPPDLDFSLEEYNGEND